MTINSYGDKLISTTGCHGADIASQRIDDLDRACLQHGAGLAGQEVSAIDLGCGILSFGARLAVLGLNTFGFDRLPEPPVVGGVQALGLSTRLQYIQRDLRELRTDDLPTNLQIIYSQRFVHYMAYGDAVRLLKIVASSAAEGSRLYLSASGIDSELGDKYPRGEISQRYDFLIPEMQEKHEIREKVCLYLERDLAQLANESGFAVVRVWKSAFGNIKGIFQKER